MFKPEIHKFNIKLLAINYSSGNTLDLTEFVNSVAIRKDFVKHVYPLYTIGLSLTEEYKNKLVKNPFYLSLKILRIPTIENDTINGSGSTPDTPITDKIITNTLLRPYGKAKTSISNIESDIEDSDVDSKSIKEKQKVQYSINCVPFEELQYNNKVLNNCYAKANVNEIALNLISESYNNNIYYQESKNIKRYDSLLIPQFSLIPALRYLQQHYLLYKNSLNIFFDDNKLFVYDIKSKERKFNNRLNIIVESNNNGNNQIKYSQNFLDESNNIQKYFNTNPFFIDTSETTNYNYGDTIFYNSYDSNFNLISRSYNNSEDLKPKDKKIRVEWNNHQLKDFEMSSLSLFKIFTEISLTNFDPSIIGPDTNISINGSDISENNGEYALLNKDIYYISNDSITFSEQVVLNLGKK